MLNPQKRNLLLGTVALLALIAVIGVVAKKKQGSAPSTEVPSESSHALGTPDAPGTPQLSQPGQPTQPGAEPGSEPSDSNEFAHNDSAGHDTAAGHKHGGAIPGLTLAMLSPAERARIQKEYPEFKGAALGGRVAPGNEESAEVNEESNSGAAQGHTPQAQAKNNKGAHGQQTAEETEANMSLPNLTLAMLSPAERERVQKKYPNLFNAEQANTSTQVQVGIQNTVNGSQNTEALAPIPTKPGQPLVLLQPGMPGHPDTPVTHTDVAQAPKPEPAVDSCYTVTYHHKHPGMRAGDESCAHHKNLIRIHAAEGLKLNSKTVCIKVNGTPVKTTQVKGKNDFIIGVVVGVETAITARFCTGKFHCTEDCKVPRDEFLDSIAGSTGDLDSEDSQKLAIAVWDKEDPNDKGADAKLAGDMQKGLKDLDEVAKAASEGYTLFQDWVPDQQQFACQNHQAQGSVADEEQNHEQPHRKVASKR